jgi:hypothetical protein
MEAVETQQGEAVETIATESEGKGIALPSTVAAFMEQRKNPTQKNLNDHVESIHLVLYEDDEYRLFLDAVHNEQAVEGSLIADDFEAARMIRAKARDMGNGYIAALKLATIVKALQVVLRRYNATRKYRREA